MVLDKTGTLTLGTPEVIAVFAAEGVTDKTVLEAAATAELPSEHPLAGAVLRVAASAGVGPARAEKFVYTPGRGIECHSLGREIVVGNLALLRERSIDVKGENPKCTVHVAVDRTSAASRSPTSSGLRPSSRYASSRT